MTKSKVGAELNKKVKHAFTKDAGIHEGIHRDEPGWYDGKLHCYCFGYGYFFHRGKPLGTKLTPNYIKENWDKEDWRGGLKGACMAVINREHKIAVIKEGTDYSWSIETGLPVGYAIYKTDEDIPLYDITDFEAADNFLLFVQLPCITIKEKANNFIACEEDCGYIPHLYKFDSQYIIDWIGEEGDSLYCINGITPERVIRTAFKWCLDKGLIINPIYIK